MLPIVPVVPKRLDDYVAHAGEEAVASLREAAQPLRGARLLHLNATAYGGGVAELLHTHIPLLQDLGIDTTWAVLDGTDEFFAVTKAAHNGLQGAEVPWTPQMEDLYRERILANAAELDEDFDLWFLHDPQPVGLLDAIEDRGGKAGAWVWRCHIDMSTTNPAVWSFFEPTVNRYDHAIFTLEDFAQPGLTVPASFIPPSIDPTSDKNLELPPLVVEEALRRFGVDPDRPMVTQVSRFDPWKDPIGVIDAYRIAREQVPDLQLVMAGSLADDDPEGQEYLAHTDAHRDGEPDIHLLTNLDGAGALEVNAFQRAAQVVIQKSTREGFGLVVAEGMWKRTPVIGGNVGGIRLQIEDGVTGFLVDSPEACGDRLVELLGDPGLRRRMGKLGREQVRERFLTLRELEDYLRVLSALR